MLQAVDIDSNIRWVPGDVVLWQGTVQYTFRGKVIDAENKLLLYRVLDPSQKCSRNVLKYDPNDVSGA